MIYLCFIHVLSYPILSSYLVIWGVTPKATYGSCTNHAKLCKGQVISALRNFSFAAGCLAVFFSPRSRWRSRREMLRLRCDFVEVDGGNVPARVACNLEMSCDLRSCWLLFVDIWRLPGRPFQGAAVQRVLRGQRRQSSYRGAVWGRIRRKKS